MTTNGNLYKDLYMNKTADKFILFLPGYVRVEMLMSQYMQLFLLMYTNLKSEEEESSLPDHLKTLLDITKSNFSQLNNNSLVTLSAARNTKNLNNNKINIVKSFFMTIKPINSRQVCNSFSNHNLILALSFNITTFASLELVKQVQDEFKCFINCFLDQNICLDYFIYQRFELHRLMSLNELNVKKLPSIERVNKINKFTEVEVQQYKIEFNPKGTEEYTAYCDSVLSSLRKKFVDAYPNEIVEDRVAYSVCVFDIECGWTPPIACLDSEEIKRCGMINALTGYVQSICLSLSPFKLKYYTDDTKYITLVYLDRSNLSIDKKEINSILEDMFKTKNMSRDNYIVEFFYSESEMIERFLCVAMRTDVLIGFNSKNFDLPFLINRLNIIENGLHYTFINNVRLFDNSFFNQIYSSMFATIKCKCLNCSNLTAIRMASNEWKCISCKNSLPPLYIGDAANKMPNFKYIKMTKDLKQKNELPFTLHIDLMLVPEITNCGTTNKKLETLVNFHFKLLVSVYDRNDINVTNDDDDFLSVISLSSYSLTACKNLKSVYLQDISICLFNICQENDEIINKKDYRLKSCEIVNKEGIPIGDKQDDCYLKFLIKRCEPSSKRKDLIFKGLYLSIGKTSDISIEESMIWSSSNRVASTIFYNIFDVIITTKLEHQKNVVSQLNYSNNLFKLPPVILFGKTEAGKSAFKYITQLIRNGNDFLYDSHKSFDQYESVRHSLKVECQTIEECIKNGLLVNYEAATSSNDMNKVFGEELISFIQKCKDFAVIPVKTLPDKEGYFNQDINLFSNEYVLQIISETDFSKFDQVHDNLKKISYSDK